MNVVHFARVGQFDSPVACGVRLGLNMSLSNKWARVTCPACGKARTRPDRPDLLVYQKYLKRERG
jgi:hypothetical protein